MLDFVTLGMLIIDEIHFPPPTPPQYDVLGGAGTYSAVGARMLSPSPSTGSVGWVADAGRDFPAALRDQIISWRTCCTLRETPERLTTRGWNGYGENESRAFRYLTPKLRLDENALIPELLTAKSFHLICSPRRCITLIEGIISKRTDMGCLDRPAIIWEPVPQFCRPDELESCFAALKHVTVVSPNLEELCAFFGKSASPRSSLSPLLAVEFAKHFLDSGVGPSGLGSVIVRAGADGCYVACGSRSEWVPAYHKDNAAKVVDPTGGGNAFLGGFAVGYVRAGVDAGFGALLTGAIYGSVAASFAIEQVGMPTLGQHHDSEETWNGESAQVRIKAYDQLG